MRSDGLIEDRLETALRYNVVNGSWGERAILSDQINDAINELRRLRRLVGDEEDAGDSVTATDELSRIESWVQFRLNAVRSVGPQLWGFAKGKEVALMEVLQDIATLRERR